jgi:hypothetical protein
MICAAWVLDRTAENRPVKYPVSPIFMEILPAEIRARGRILEKVSKNRLRATINLMSDPGDIKLWHDSVPEPSVNLYGRGLVIRIRHPLKIWNIP